MNTNQIIAWLRVRAAARFNRQMNQATRNVRQFGRAAKGAVSPTDLWSQALQQFQGILGSGAGGIGGRTRIFGFAIGTVVTAAVSAIPIMVGLGGAITAIAGSFGAATLGAGALLTGLGAVAAVGFGGLGLAIGQTMNDFKKVQTAVQAYQVAVASYGRTSDQAATAQKHLNGVVAVFGGNAILEAVMAWEDLKKTFARAITPATHELAEAFRYLVVQAKDIIPVFADVTNKSAKALGGVLRDIMSQIKGPLITAFKTLSPAFSSIIGPVGQAVTDLFLGLLTIAQKVAPMLGRVAGYVGGLASAFRDWAESSDFSGIIGQFWTWIDLLDSVGALVITILGGGAGEGQNLVKWLTIIVDKWNAWLNTDHGQKEMASFFRDAGDMAKAFAGIIVLVAKGIFLFGRALLPLYTKAFKGATSRWGEFMDALAPAKPFWDNVLGPFIKGFATGVGDTLSGAFEVLIFLVGGFAKILGWVGDKLEPLSGAFNILGRVLGFLFGGPILRALGTLGKYNILLKPLAFGFRQLAKPIEALGWIVSKTFGFFGGLIRFFGRLAGDLIPGVRTAFEAVLRFVASLGGRFYNAGKSLWTRMRQGIMEAIGTGLAFAGDIAKNVANALIHLLNSAIPNKIPIPHFPDIDLPDNPIPKLAGGGVVSGSGTWITGEAGPELNTLRGGRVSVQPLPAVSAPGLGAYSLDPRGSRNVNVTKIYLRGRQIAEAVADEAEDARANA